MNLRLILLLFVIIVCCYAHITKKNYVITADLGTESCRVGIFDKDGKLISTASSPYKTEYPLPGYAEQNPNDWWNNLKIACHQAMQNQDIRSEDIIGMCIDTTACSVCILDEEMKPLCNAILWCDARSAKQTEEILSICKSNPSLNVNCNGYGPLSAEWMIPKALWVKQNQPELYIKSRYICEKQDYMNYYLTGNYIASGCNVNARWHWNGSQPPISLLKQLNCSELLDKWPKKCIYMGEQVGTLTAHAANELHLKEGVPIFQGGPDAYVGMLGLGVTDVHKLALITGSSHLHLIVSDHLSYGKGFWGTYKNSPVFGLNFAEGGQSSTGSLLQWGRRLFNQNGINLKQKLLSTSSASSSSASSSSIEKDNNNNNNNNNININDVDNIISMISQMDVTFQELDYEASIISPGANGLLCLETFQGSRTPITDAKARGAFIGMSLYHTRGHIWRSMLEGICMGTRNCIDALHRSGLTANEIYIGGGATRSPLFLQMHSDVTGLPVVVMEVDNAPLLGCAIIAAAGCHLHDEDLPNENEKRDNNIQGNHDSADSDIHVPTPETPTASSQSASLDSTNVSNTSNNNDNDSTDIARLQVLKRIQYAVKKMVRIKQTLYPQSQVTRQYTRLFNIYKQIGPKLKSIFHELVAFNNRQDINSDVEYTEDNHNNTLMISQDIGDKVVQLKSGNTVDIVPSILSADYGHLSLEAEICTQYSDWIHIDACDGGKTAPGALTVGPHTVAYIHENNPILKLDVHLVHESPHLLINAFANAGTTRLTLQYEQLGNTENIQSLCHTIRSKGMSCGLCLAPSTDVKVLHDLSELLTRYSGNTTPVVEYIDILAVQPGYGGQKFNETVLDKIEYIKTHFPDIPYIGIDGGINDLTIQKAITKGANFIIAGSHIFGKNRQYQEENQDNYYIRNKIMTLKNVIKNM